MDRTHFAAIGMGSNLKDPYQNMVRAVALLQDLPGCQAWRFSPLFVSEAVDCPEPFDYLNAAACCQTDLAPEALLERLLDIEQEFGRVRPYPNAPRTLDLDLLLYEDLIISSPRLRLPHPRMSQRLFVLEPLARICGERIHPEEKCSVGALLDQCRRGVFGRFGVTKSPQPWPDALF